MILDYDPSIYEDVANKFVNQWVLGWGCQILKVIRLRNNSRAEDFLFYRNKDGVIGCCTLPRKGSGYKPCNFGNIDHFCRTVWANTSTAKAMCEWPSYLLEAAWWFDRRNMTRIHNAVRRMIGVGEVEFSNPKI